MRIGHGYDVHRFTEDRKLMLGGVHIPYEFGLDGHSDADVCLHAIMDAILGALALGDIGRHFSDQDAAYLGIDSKELLKQVVEMMKKKNMCIGNIDVTIIAQVPKLAPHIDSMVQVIANLLHTEIENVNIKATTEERLGFTGRKEGISCHCVALITSN